MELQRRADIDGLRTVSAILVATFHIWFGGVSGGVDVFFVLTGYFVTKRSLATLSKTNAFDIIDHYRKFFTRTAPEILLALAGIALAGLMLTHPIFWEPLLKELSASAIYLENYHLINMRRDYLARDERLSIVQHFWAISLIGQFYLIWPVIINSGIALSRLSQYSIARIIQFVLTVLAAISFAWSIIQTKQSPDVAYFDFFARFWEFGVGGVIALRQEPCKISQVNKVLLSWLGLFLILSCGVAIGSTQQFPGFASLWPVTAACLLLVAGSGATTSNAGALLSVPFLTQISSLSFGVYLWHWPLFWIAKNNGHMETLGASLVVGFAIMFLSLILSWAGREIIEAFRGAKFPRTGKNSSKGKNYQVVSFIACFSILAWVFDAASRSVKEVGLLLYQIPVLQTHWNPSGLEPNPFLVKSDLAEVHRKCQTRDSKVKICHRGDSRGSTTIAVVGSSHAGHWAPALEKISEKYSLKLIVMLKSGCRFGLMPDDIPYKDSSCQNWNKKVMEILKELKPNFVFTLGIDRRRGQLLETIPSGYISAFSELKSLGIDVIALRDTPQMKVNAPDCIFSSSRQNWGRCGVARAAVLNDEILNVARESYGRSVNLLDLTDLLCDKIKCGVVKGGKIIYWDRQHLTATFSSSLAGELKNRLDAVLGDWVAPRQSEQLR